MDADERYRSLILDALRISANYRPRFGLGRRRGVTLEEFTAQYSADPLYSWIGLDSPAIYAAHKAAGGITSIYRQIGIGCERLFQTLLQDTFGLTQSQSTWQYSTPRPSGGHRTLKLDGRIDLEHLSDLAAKRRVSDWILEFRRKLDVRSDTNGAVFEVRQGYKSKDSKRQNADLANAAAAYTQQYLPVLVVMSLQLDTDLRIRYEGAKWGVLSGSTDTDDPYTSTYAFCREVIGYDLAAFFERNSNVLRNEVEAIVYTLLGES